MGSMFLCLLTAAVFSQMIAFGAFAAEPAFKLTISNPVQVRYRHQNLVVVIDDSASFFIHTETAHKIFTAFPADLLNKYDQILITTTSTDSKWAKIVVFSPQDYLDAVAQFRQNVQVGSDGSGTERPLVRLAQLSKMPDLQSFFEVPNQVLIITEEGEDLGPARQRSSLGKELKVLQSVFNANDLGYSSKAAVLALSQGGSCPKLSFAEPDEGVLLDFLRLQNAKIFDLCDPQTPNALVDHLQAEIKALYHFRKKISLGTEGFFVIPVIKLPMGVLDSSVELRLNGVKLVRESGNPNGWDFISGGIVFGNLVDLKSCHADPKCTVEISYVLGNGQN